MKFLIQKSLAKNLVLAFSGWELSWKGFINNNQGEWWLVGQILLILAHFSPASPPTITLGFVWPKICIFFGINILCIGIFLIIKSFLSLGVNLSPLPKPKSKASLVMAGRYKYCRHPLYQALLISSIGSIITLGSFLHLSLFIGLCALLIGKAKKEESQLKIKHKEYIDYLKNTPAIINNLPFLDWRA